MQSIGPPSACSSEPQQFAAEIFRSPRLSANTRRRSRTRSAAWWRPSAAARWLRAQNLKRCAAQPATRPSGAADECGGRFVAAQKPAKRFGVVGGKASKEQIVHAGQRRALPRDQFGSRGRQDLCGLSDSAAHRRCDGKLAIVGEGRKTQAAEIDNGRIAQFRPGSTNGSRARSSTRSPIATSATYFAIGPAWAVIPCWPIGRPWLQ